MLCPYCNYNLTPDDKFCPSCGSKVEVKETQTPFADESAPVFMDENEGGFGAFSDDANMNISDGIFGEIQEPESPDGFAPQDDPWQTQVDPIPQEDDSWQIDDIPAEDKTMQWKMPETPQSAAPQQMPPVTPKPQVQNVSHGNTLADFSPLAVSQNTQQQEQPAEKKKKRKKDKDTEVYKAKSSGSGTRKVLVAIIVFLMLIIIGAGAFVGISYFTGGELEIGDIDFSDFDVKEFFEGLFNRDSQTVAVDEADEEDNEDEDDEKSNKDDTDKSVETQVGEPVHTQASPTVPSSGEEQTLPTAAVPSEDRVENVDYYDVPFMMAVYSEHNLYLRVEANQEAQDIILMKMNSPLTVLGVSTLDSKWYYVRITQDGATYEGFCHSDYLVYP